MLATKLDAVGMLLDTGALAVVVDVGIVGVVVAVVEISIGGGTASVVDDTEVGALVIACSDALLVVAAPNGGWVGENGAVGTKFGSDVITTYRSGSCDVEVALVKD